ncbi:NAD(P)/FAD-dependent oxidoreductase [Neobacillus dielmonensis]|uniref:NAD(P)/FAD-dependent oxidoreductase n=1 Tax=Neobacillus dielmonensis TaxID=1347369 RepID=UPI0005A8BC4E|nr:FAD-dependent oxidoreductase [Neobacillus dielmonensis]
MFQKRRIIVVGGGYAGIHVIKHLRKESNHDLEIILVDKNDFHFKKVKLFKTIVEEKQDRLMVPLTEYCGSGVQFVQGELSAIDRANKKVELRDPLGGYRELLYDNLVLALGSVAKKQEDGIGGRSLSDLVSAMTIRKELLEKIHSGKSGLRIAIVGGGITGVETAAELVVWLKNEAISAGMMPSHVEVLLINKQKGLLPDAPKKASELLEHKLKIKGVQSIHQAGVEKFQDGIIHLCDGSQLMADYCIWTIGMSPNPSLKLLGLPLQENGQIKTDSWYRVDNTKHLYSIGDCAHIIDTLSGKAAAMSCKEAIIQAKRLAKIILADLQGVEAEAHKSIPQAYCIGLGPKDAVTWAQKWGLNFVLTGKLAAKIREYTWEYASQ